MPEHDPYAALRHRNFRFYVVGNVLSVLGIQLQTFTITWEIWERTKDFLLLGTVGLVQVVPIIALTLFAGHTADRFSRKRILYCTLSLLLVASLVLAANSYYHGPLAVSYAALFMSGVARAFQQPAKSALVPQLVPRDVFPNAITWNMGGFHLASVAGPAIGGFILGRTHDPVLIYVLDAVLAALFAVLLFPVKALVKRERGEPFSLNSLVVGAKFVWNHQVLLGAMSLDMFAVLLGGATAMLPVFQQILHVGPSELGWMKAMQAIGALSMSLVLAHRPPLQKAGKSLLWAVAGFGLVTIGFGLSRSYALTLVLLYLLGALDMISVVVRHTLMQLLTPDTMRGRVSSVNGMFISISNELGEAESGFVADLFDSATFSVVSGGIGTILVVAVAALRWPLLRNYGSLAQKPEEVESEELEERTE